MEGVINMLFCDRMWPSHSPNMYNNNIKKKDFVIVSLSGRKNKTKRKKCLGSGRFPELASTVSLQQLRRNGDQYVRSTERQLAKRKRSSPMEPKPEGCHRVWELRKSKQLPRSPSPIFRTSLLLLVRGRTWQGGWTHLNAAQTLVYL